MWPRPRSALCSTQTTGRSSWSSWVGPWAGPVGFPARRLSFSLLWDSSSRTREGERTCPDAPGIGEHPREEKPHAVGTGLGSPAHNGADSRSRSPTPDTWRGIRFLAFELEHLSLVTWGPLGSQDTGSDHCPKVSPFTPWRMCGHRAWLLCGRQRTLTRCRQSLTLLASPVAGLSVAMCDGFTLLPRAPGGGRGKFAPPSPLLTVGPNLSLGERGG